MRWCSLVSHVEADQDIPPLCDGISFRIQPSHDLKTSNAGESTTTLSKLFSWFITLKVKIVCPMSDITMNLRYPYENSNSGVKPASPNYTELPLASLKNLHSEGFQDWTQNVIVKKTMILQAWFLSECSLFFKCNSPLVANPVGALILISNN